MHYVYFIQNDVNGKVYIGHTQDLVSRLKQHNGGGRKYTTLKNGSWQYIYVELYRSKIDALERERKLKYHAKGKQELFKRLKHSMLKPKIGEGSAA